MAVHKVPQDVEADDKFLGPLSFKQFVFFGGVLVCLFLMYQTFSIGVPYLSIIVMPFFIVCVTLAFPWTKDQPTELWLASRIRFLMVPRKRIWDQDGIEEHVTITVPKREVHIYSDGLSQDQVKSRLSALANVVDSKGWAAKDTTGAQDFHSDRLVGGSGYANDPLQQHDIHDVLDDTNSDLAQQMGTLIAESEDKRKQNAQDMMQSLHGNPNAQQQPINSPWFLQQQPLDTAEGMQKLKSDFNQSLEEQKFLTKVHDKEEQEAKANARGHMKRVQRAGDTGESLIPKAGAGAGAQNIHGGLPQKPLTPLQQQATTTASAQTEDPAILALASRDDLNVSTIARQANVYNVTDDDEVVVTFHNEKTRK